MTKNSYETTMPIEVTNNRGAKYRLPEKAKGANHGELCESIVKWQLGLYTPNNPTTSYDNGSDIEELNASVKSSHASLGRTFGDSKNTSEAIRYYFRHVHSTLFIWAHYDEKTRIMTEYHMDKKEFGRFVRTFMYCHMSNSKNHKMEIRFPSTSKKLIAWFEAQCAC